MFYLLRKLNGLNPTALPVGVNIQPSKSIHWLEPVFDNLFEFILLFLLYPHGIVLNNSSFFSVFYTF